MRRPRPRGGRKDVVRHSARLDGERAGFIDKAFDLQFLDSLEGNPEWATRFSIHERVERPAPRAWSC